MLNMVFPEHIQDINGTLHFNQVQMQDKGKYTCVATNSQGLINITIDIDVVGKLCLHQIFIDFYVLDLDLSTCIKALFYSGGELVL